MNTLWRTAHFLTLRGGVLALISHLFEVLNYVIFSNHIPGTVSIGEGTRIEHHGIGCVFHGKTVIGKNCKIFQNVTIGARWSKSGIKDGVPTIGDNVQIGAGAVILGKITIGSNSSIGANAVVLSDVPDNCIAIGVPAKIIKKLGEQPK